MSAGVATEIDDATMRARSPSRRTSASASRCAGRRPSSATAPEADPADGSPHASRTRPRPGARGRPSTTSTTARTAIWYARARGCSRASPTARPARSWPPRRRRSRRPWAASATGTTATPGSATRASRMEALYIGACSDEAEEFVSFMTSSAGGRAAGRSLQIMYGIGGEHDLTERELPHLRGLARVAPGARRQRRLGPDAARRVRRAAQRDLPVPRALGELHPEIQAFVADLADTAARRWRETDAGHVGDARRAAPPPVLEGPVLDGARPRREAGAPARRVRQARALGERLATRSAPRCSSAAGARRSRRYAQSFDSDELDAAQLLMPIFGFLPADDPRMRSTIEAIADGLTEDGLVLRYRNDEGSTQTA